MTTEKTFVLPDGNNRPCFNCVQSADAYVTQYLKGFMNYTRRQSAVTPSRAVGEAWAAQDVKDFVLHECRGIKCRPQLPSVRYALEKAYQNGEVR